MITTERSRQIALDHTRGTLQWHQSWLAFDNQAANNKSDGLHEAQQCIQGRSGKQLAQQQGGLGVIPWTSQHMLHQDFETAPKQMH